MCINQLTCMRLRDVLNGLLLAPFGLTRSRRTQRDMWTRQGQMRTSSYVGVRENHDPCTLQGCLNTSNSVLPAPRNHCLGIIDKDGKTLIVSPLNKALDYNRRISHFKENDTGVIYAFISARHGISSSHVSMLSARLAAHCSGYAPWMPRAVSGEPPI